MNEAFHWGDADSSCGYSAARPDWPQRKEAQQVSPATAGSDVDGKLATEITTYRQDMAMEPGRAETSVT